MISCLGTVVDRYTDSRGRYIVESRRGAVKACDDRLAVEKALRMYESACLPASERVLYPELAALRSMTKVAQADQDDIKLQMRVYARQLQAYPGDVALHVLRTQPGMEKWWPSWSELKERLDLYAGKRKERRQQLRELLALSQDHSAACESPSSGA